MKFGGCNINPVTDIAYGVINLNNLDPELADELMFGTQAKNLTEAQAIKEIESGADESLTPDEVEDLVAKELEDYQIEEPTIKGEYEGVKYQISWLGGAPILWVFEGPIGEVRSQCSPCVPNAGDMDSGIISWEEDDLEDVDVGYRCYVVPKDWLCEESD